MQYLFSGVFEVKDDDYDVSFDVEMSNVEMSRLNNNTKVKIV